MVKTKLKNGVPSVHSKQNFLMIHYAKLDYFQIITFSEALGIPDHESNLKEF